MADPKTSEPGRWTAFRRRLHAILEMGQPGDRTSLIFDNAMVVLILANVIAFTLESVGQIRAEYGPALNLFNIVSIGIFIVEYVLRLWVSDQAPELRHLDPVKARLRHARSAFMLIDLAVILPFFLSLLFVVDLRVLRVFRLLRFLKLFRFSPALSVVASVIYTERRALFGKLIVVIGLLTISASIIHLVEGPVQPDDFGSIPEAMWWAISTLTTTGFGDVVPVTPLGKIIAGFVMILGFATFALPLGIIATGFAQESHRRDFVSELEIIARIPMFRDLTAKPLVKIMALLRSKTLAPHTTIFHKGEWANGMFFIAYGDVELVLGDRTVRLEEGDSFGAISLLASVQREATARTLSECQLLFISAQDFRLLLEADAELHGRIMKAARRSYGDAISDGGDLAPSELEGEDED